MTHRRSGSSDATIELLRAENAMLRSELATVAAVETVRLDMFGAGVVIGDATYELAAAKLGLLSEVTRTELGRRGILDGIRARLDWQQTQLEQRPSLREVIARG